MSSKYLSSLSKLEYENLKSKLHQMQNQNCFICLEPIDLTLHQTNIDHIVPLANRGKDSEENFAITHENCNKSKLDSNLEIARRLHVLKKIQDKVQSDSNKSASLKHVLEYFNGSKYQFRYNISDGLIEYSFSNNGDNTVYKTVINKDILSNEESIFIEVPIEYVFHDELINPRGINSSISMLVKEFHKKNPQLHLTLARIDDNYIRVFDGQHKAVAQLLLGVKKLFLRIFIKPDIDRLIETNTNAGSTLRQIAFDKSIMRQLNNTLYYERIRKYQNDHNLREDDFSFSEQQLVEYFKGENVNIKKYIVDSIKHSIVYSKDNKLRDYIDFGGKSKETPISYSAFDKTFLSQFIDSKLILNTPINHKSDEGLNPRELEITQMVELLNILSEEIYIGKFIPDVGVAKIEDKIIRKKDTEITDDHLIAYRISKEEVFYNWLLFLQKVIENYFSNTGKIFYKNRLFQQTFEPQLWKNIRNFVRNLKSLPLWKDRNLSSTIFSGKQNYDFWKTIFETGKTPDNVQVIARPLNYVEMIKADNSI